VKKILSLTLVLMFVFCTVSYATPIIINKNYYTCNKEYNTYVDSNEEADYQLLAGAEVNILPPKYKTTLIKDKYLELDQVNVGHYVNTLDKVTEAGNHTTAIVAHFNLFKE
jgi:hypothetical protein